MTILEFLTLTLEWLTAEFEVGTIDEVIKLMRKRINLTEKKAKDWYDMAKRLTICWIIISYIIFLAGIAVGGFIKEGWPNSIAGLFITPLLFIVLARWTPLVALITVIFEVAHFRIKGTLDAALTQAKWWLGLICGILLWQTIVSLAFTFIPYWNAPSRVPVLMLLAIAMALMGVHWSVSKRYRSVIKILVITIFITQILVCFFPNASTALHSRIGKTDQSMAAKIERGEFFTKAAPAVPAPTRQDMICLDSGVYNFNLKAGETNDQWIKVKNDHQYSFSSSTANDPVRQWFFIVYKNGKMIKIDRADADIPPGPGPFKLMGGENGAYIKLLIVKKT